MKINLKQFSKTNKILFIIFNILMIFSFAVLSVVYSVIKGISGIDEAHWIGILMLIVFGVFSVVNLARVFIEIAIKRKIEKTIEKMITDKKYSEAITYLNQIGRTKHFYNTNQMMYSYLGYLHFSLDLVDDAVYYMKKIDFDKQYVVNSNYLILRIYLLYLYYFINNDEKSLKEVTLIYHNKKTKLLKVIRGVKSKERVKRIFDIIDSLVKGVDKSTILKLSDSNVSNIPFVKRFIEYSLKQF